MTRGFLEGAVRCGGKACGLFIKRLVRKFHLSARHGLALRTRMHDANKCLEH